MAAVRRTANAPSFRMSRPLSDETRCDASPDASSVIPLASLHQEPRAIAGVTRHAATAASCTPATDRPDGSAALANAGSHSSAAVDEQAIDLPPGTVAAQASPG